MSKIYVDMCSYRWIGYGFFILALPCIAIPLLSSHYRVSIIFVALAAIGLYLGLGSGKYAIDEEDVSFDTRLGCWRMGWSEVTSAQYSVTGSLLLIGPGKRFALAPPIWWPRARRDEVHRFVLDRLAVYHVVPSLSRTADYKWMKNTRV